VTKPTGKVIFLCSSKAASQYNVTRSESDKYTCFSSFFFAPEKEDSVVFSAAAKKQTLDNKIVVKILIMMPVF